MFDEIGNVGTVVIGSVHYFVHCKDPLKYLYDSKHNRFSIVMSLSKWPMICFQLTMYCIHDQLTLNNQLHVVTVLGTTRSNSSQYN